MYSNSSSQQNNSLSWDNSSHSQILIAIGAHRKSSTNETNSEDNNSNFSSRSSQTIDNSGIQPIVLDLNNLQSEDEVPHGCKVDVYVTVRHSPGCKHKMKQEFNVGLKKFDYIGKGTYRYRMEGEEDPRLRTHSEYKRKCREFSEKCDMVMREVSQPILNMETDKVIKRGTVYHVIDKYSFNENVTTSRVKKSFSGRLTSSEIDLYEWDFLN